MLYVLYGTDTDKSREKLHRLVDVLRAKKPDATYVRITDETFDPDELDQLVGGQGLFEQKLIVVFNEVFLDADAKAVVVKRLKDMAKSENIFLIRETIVDTSTRKKFEKYAEKVEEHNVATPASKSNPFSIFELSDELGVRNAKKLWVLYHSAKRHNISDEEIHGILLWQVKSMLLAEICGNAEDAKLNPFVFRKAKQFVKNYNKDETRQLSSDLVKLYHESRRGGPPLGIALECFILSI